MLPSQILNQTELIFAAYACAFLFYSIWNIFYLIVPVRRAVRRPRNKWNLDDFTYTAGFIILLAVAIGEVLWNIILALGHITPQNLLKNISVIPPICHQLAVLLIVTVWR